MNLVGTSFFQNQDTFLWILNKGRGDLPPPPSSYAPVFFYWEHYFSWEYFKDLKIFVIIIVQVYMHQKLCSSNLFSIYRQLNMQ